MVHIPRRAADGSGRDRGRHRLAVHVQDTGRAGHGARDRTDRHRRGRRRRDRLAAAGRGPGRRQRDTRAQRLDHCGPRHLRRDRGDRADRLDPLRTGPGDDRGQSAGRSPTSWPSSSSVRRPLGAHLGRRRAVPCTTRPSPPRAPPSTVSPARRTPAVPTSRACRPPSTRPGSERRGDPRRARHGDGGQPRHARRPGAGDDRGCRLRAPPRRGRPSSAPIAPTARSPVWPGASSVTRTRATTSGTCSPSATTSRRPVAAPSMHERRGRAAASIPRATSRAGPSRKQPGCSTVPALPTTSSTRAATSSPGVSLPGDGRGASGSATRAGPTVWRPSWSSVTGPWPPRSTYERGRHIVDPRTGSR